MKFHGRNAEAHPDSYGIREARYLTTYQLTKYYVWLTVKNEVEVAYSMTVSWYFHRKHELIVGQNERRSADSKYESAVYHTRRGGSHERTPERCLCMHSTRCVIHTGEIYKYTTKCGL